MFRDPLAVSLRNQISMNYEFIRSLKTFQQQFEVQFRFLKAVKAPVLLLSYEKILASPLTTLPTLMNFAGVENYDLDTLCTNVRPNDEDYLNAAMGGKRI